MSGYQKKVTLKEIAENTGVSLGTVHRVIYGKPGVGNETRERILEEIKKSNYQVDEAASVMKRKVKNILVVLPKAQGDNRFYFRAIWKGAREAAEGMDQYKLHFRFIESEYSDHEIAKKLQEVFDDYMDVDGLITVADNEEANRWVNRFVRRGTIVILLSTNYYEEENEPIPNMIECIRVDHLRGGHLAGEFLSYALAEKKGKVLVVYPNGERYGVKLRGQGLMEELKEHRPDIEIVKIPSLSNEEARKLFASELEKEDTVGVFCCNARNTYRACCILDQCDRKKDMICVGSDIFEELVPFFENGTLNASVCQDHWDQGGIAVQKMYEYLSRGTQLTKETLLPSELVLRNNFSYFV